MENTTEMIMATTKSNTSYVLLMLFPFAMLRPNTGDTPELSDEVMEIIALITRLIKKGKKKAPTESAQVAVTE